LLISEVETETITIMLDIHYASTDTRLEGFETSVVVDNKRDINNIIEEKRLIYNNCYIQRKNLKSRPKC